MLVMKVATRKLLTVIRFVVALLKRIFCCWRRRKSSAVLPVTVDDSKQLHSESAHSLEQWNSWSNKPFANVVEEKIEEYRRKRIEQISQPAESPEAQQNFFDDMQPDVKQTQKVFVGNTRDSKSAQKGNLFAFADDSIPQSALGATGELGLMDDNSEGENDAWDTAIDIEGVDDVIKKQREMERKEKRRQRQIEHERRFAEKRGGVPY